MATFEKYIWNSTSNIWELVEIPISQVTGLQGVLDGKAPYVHSHGWDTISGKPSWITPTKPVYNLGEVEETTIYKRVTQSEKNAWNAKQNQAQVEALIGSYDTNIVTPQLAQKLSSSLKGSANGLAELDANGKVPSAQLPSFVDDVLEYTNLASFPTTGESGKIYIDLATNKTYRWGGSAYVVISDTISLGETFSTAYRGDRGKIAYDHSQVAHAPSNAQKNSDITKAEIEAKLTGAITSHTHTYNLDQISDGSTYKRVTQSEKNKISDYLSTFNAANKLLKLDGSSNLSLGGSINAGSFYGDIWTDYISSDSDFINIGGGVSEVQINAYKFAVKGASDGIFLEDAPFINVGGTKITNLGAPSATTDAATKAYVDGLIGGEVSPTYTLLGSRSSIGSQTINNASDYTMFLITFTVIVDILNGMDFTKSFFASNQGQKVGVNFFNHNDIANVFLNASMSGSTLSVDDNGEMPFSMIGGTKGFSVTVYGVKFE